VSLTTSVHSRVYAEITTLGEYELKIIEKINSDQLQNENSPLFLHGVGHYALPPPPSASANLQYKAIYQSVYKIDSGFKSIG